MLSGVLKSDRAIDVNIAVIRAFIRLRELIATHRDVAAKIQEIERIQRDQGTNISAISSAVPRINPRACTGPSFISYSNCWNDRVCRTRMPPNAPRLCI